MAIIESITKRFFTNRKEIDLAFAQLENKMASEFMKAKFAEVNDSVKYIADIDSYELLWMNETLKAMLIERNIEWKGKRCFEVLQDLPVPCEFCTNSQLIDEGKVITWTHNNEKLGKVFLVRDFLVKIEGRQLRFENAIDITNQVKTIQSYG